MAEEHKDSEIPAASDPAAAVGLITLFWTFLRIGATAFGGFMALISVVQNICVERRGWLGHEEMLDGISLATLLPGPVAVNVVAYVGYRLRGPLGALISAVAVIIPAFLLVLGLTIFYFRWGEVPAVGNAFAAFLPAVTAIIVSTGWNMGRKSIKSRPELALAVGAAALLLGVGGFYITLAIIAIAGAVGLALFGRAAATGPAAAAVPTRPMSRTGLALTFLLLAGLIGLFLAPLPGLGASSWARIIVTFGGMSLMLFGGGFVFIPLIQEIVVAGLHWVTQTEFATAIALGQVTPGPILLSAAFIGYKLQGIWGAFLATVAIFSPPALLMVSAAQMMDRIKSSRSIQAALRGIRAAVIGMIFSAAVVIMKTVNLHWLSAVIFLGGLIALLRWRVDAVWIIPVAGVLGVVFY